MITETHTFFGPAGTTLATLWSGGVVARTFCASYAVLNCCPMDIDVVFDLHGTALKGGFSISTATPYTEGIDIGGCIYSSVPCGSYVVTAVRLESAGSIVCDSEDFEIKMCLMFSDLDGSPDDADCPCTLNCGASASYVEVL